MNFTITSIVSREDIVELKQLKPGDPFFYAVLSFHEACENTDFWMKVDAPEIKGRVRVVNLSDGRQQERDEDHRVIRVTASLSVEDKR